jgi:hypothetical protein
MQQQIAIIYIMIKDDKIRAKGSTNLNELLSWKNALILPSVIYLLILSLSSL